LHSTHSVVFQNTTHHPFLISLKPNSFSPSIPLLTQLPYSLNLLQSRILNTPNQPPINPPPNSAISSPKTPKFPNPLSQIRCLIKFKYKANLTNNNMKILPALNPKCPVCHSPAKKMGLRKCKQRTTQRYLCKPCNHSFTAQPPLQKSKTYPLKTILNAISAYNLGQSLRKITNQNKESIPSSTLHNWIRNINLPMNRLRNKIKNTPKHEIIIKNQFIHHKQPFLFQYHSLKLDFAKKFPALVEYLKNINSLLPKGIFNSSQRISRVKPEEVEINTLPKQNYAVELSKLAASITKDNKQRHNIIENFMLINDTATIAAEIPIYLKAEETKLNQNLTGHIDILQLRFHKLYILDYKPEPINKEQTINQLKLYRKALSKRAQIPEYKFKLAFFNDKGYYEIN